VSYKYFSDLEAKGMSNELMAKLDTARAVAGVAFRITSGLRTVDSNSSAGGVEDSSHLSGKAVDLALEDGIGRFSLVRGLLAAGFKRIGIYDHHIHCDVDEAKPQNVIWIGVSH